MQSMTMRNVPQARRGDQQRAGHSTTAHPALRSYPSASAVRTVGAMGGLLGVLREWDFILERVEEGPKGANLGCCHPSGVGLARGEEGGGSEPGLRSLHK